MAELADAPDLGSGALRRGGSSPFARTTNRRLFWKEQLAFVFTVLTGFKFIIMNITRENIDELNVVLKITIEKNDYEKPVADQLKEYRQKASIPGFRPGKIPN